MKLMRTLTASAAAIALTSAFATVATPVLAQQTISDIRGSVADSSGAPLSGARVVVTDTRTGISRNLTTNNDGDFSARNLTVGGPYTVSVSMPGFRSERLEGVNVSLAASTSLSFNLETAAVGVTSDEIVVVATRDTVSELAIGPSSSFGLAELQSYPSIGRDIKDIIRIDPRVRIDGANANSITCVGSNERGNSFTVDGVRYDDAFGLNNGGFPTQALPIPFDSIKETSVEFAPYDVEYGQFTGCNINLVTQTGSNEFHGSAFAVYSSDGLTGATIEGRDVLSDARFRDYNWGASIGGPIIKDKLFFNVAYEETDDAGDVVDTGVSDGGFANPIAGVTSAEAQQVSQIIQDQYGFPAGGLLRELPETSRRILGRLDWYITDDHRLEFTYGRTRENFQNEEGGSGFGADNSDEDNSASLGSNFFNTGNNSELYSARLFSQWTDNLSTELRASRSDIQGIADPLNGGEAQDAVPFPRFVVDVPSGGSVVAGPGVFRSANDLRTQTDQIKVKADYVVGNHTFTAGYELDQLDVFNLFIVNGTGELTFDSVEDLQNGVASSFGGNGSFTGDPVDAAAEFSRSIHSIYLQDEWRPNDQLTVALGLRYDFFTSGDDPLLNERFASGFTQANVDALEAAGFRTAGYVGDNTQGYDGLDVIMPRLGVTYDAGETVFGETTFRAGAGVFAGGDPTVWFANSYQNTGFGNAFGFVAGPIDVSTPQALAAAQQSLAEAQQASTAAQTGDISLIDPDFKLPSIIRANFGFTHFTNFNGAAGGFFDDWTVNIDVLHTRNRNPVNFVELAVVTNENAPDGRPLYQRIDFADPDCIPGTTAMSGPGSADCRGEDDQILLTNGEGGKSTVLSASFAKNYEWTGPRGLPGGVDLSFGYAFTDAEELHPATSSIATSNYGNVSAFDPNNVRVATANNETRHNLTMAATFRQEFVRNYETSISFFSSVRRGRPFSYNFATRTGFEDFGDTEADEDRALLYIPSGPGAMDDPNVTYAAGFDLAAFNSFIAANGLGEFRGGVAPRNAFNSDWFIDLDMRFQQQFPGVREQDRAIFFVDIENLPNLISDSANVFRQVEFEYNAPIVEANIVDGQYEFVNFNPARADQDLDNLFESLWQVQIGFRYEF